MILAVHDYLGEALGDGGARPEDWHVESLLQVTFRQVLEEGQLFFVSIAEDLE
jgi:hypothetical protein